MNLGTWEFVSCDDCSGSIFLQSQGLRGRDSAFVGVGPDRPPRARMRRRVPHRLGAQVNVVVRFVSAGAAGDRVDDLPSANAVPFEWKGDYKSAGLWSYGRCPARWLR